MKRMAGIGGKLARAFGAALAALAIGGCTMQSADEGPGAHAELFAYERGVAPSAAQAEVARSLGCTESQIRAMEDEGMSSADWARIVPAEAMLRHLEAKYPGVAFEASWITVPSALDSGYTLGCVASPSSSGLRGECEIEAWQGDDGLSRYAENYFGIARGDEHLSMVEAVVAELAEAKGIPEESVAVGAAIVGSYDESFDAQTDLGSRLPDVYSSIHLYVSETAGMDEAAYGLFVDAVVKELETRRFQGDYQADLLAAFPKGSAFDADNAAWWVAQSTPEKPTFRWHRGGPLGQAGA